MSHRLLRASAGTGKTFRLVAHYADLIETHGLSPARIVAITFTKKAAGELRERIEKVLAARGASATTLQALGHAPIGNFHSIALILLEKLGVLPPYARETVRILGEAGEDASLFREACHGAWLVNGTEEKAAFAALAPHFDLASGLPDALWEALSRAREDDVAIDATLMRPYAVDACVAEASAQAAQLKERLRDGDEAFTSAARDSARAFAAAWTNFDASDSYETIETKVATGLAAISQLNLRQPSLRRCVDKEMRDTFVRALEAIRAEVRVGALATPLRQLVTSAWKRYEARKQALGALDFADLIQKLRDALLLLSPEVFEAVLGFRAILVDEAQDTNRLQRKLIHALARWSDGEAAPRGDEAAGASASLFVVGDWKQSIYTFRGADPQSFSLFAEDILGRAGAEETLKTSRRSRSRIITGINSLGVTLFADAYEPLAPWSLLETTRPRASVTPGLFWHALGDEDAPGVFSAGPQAEAEAAAAHVARHLAAGTPAGEIAILVSAMTHAAWFVDALSRRKIAVTLGGGGGFFARPEIADTLALLSWIFDPALELEAAVALRSPLFALSDDALMWLLGPEGRAEERLTQLRENAWSADRESECPSATRTPFEKEGLSRAAQIVAELCALAAHAGAVTLIARTQLLLEQRALCFLQTGGEQAAANLDRFLEMAEEHDRRFGPSSERFVARMRRRQAEGPDERLAVASENAQQAVTLTTVHQAKGLEFEVVILPLLAASGRNDAPDVAWSRERQELVFRARFGRESVTPARYASQSDVRRAAEEAETRRRLYVAVTRARTRIDFVGPWPRRIGRKGFAKWLGPWAESCPAELTVLAHDVLPETPENSGAPNTVRQRASRRVADAERALLSPPDALPPVQPSLQPISVTTLARQAEGKTSVASEKLWTQAPLLVEEEVPDSPPSDATLCAWHSAPLDANLLGDLAHQVLAELEDYDMHSGDDAFVRRGLERLGYAADDARLGHLREDLVAFLQSPLGCTLKFLSPDRRHHEWPFAMKIGSGASARVMRGQIDLIAQTDDALIIVDFKYAFARGEVAPYKIQLEAYAWALSAYLKMQTSVRCVLVYLKERDETRWFEADERSSEAIRMRLEQA